MWVIDHLGTHHGPSPISEAGVATFHGLHGTFTRFTCGGPEHPIDVAVNLTVGDTLSINISKLSKMTGFHPGKGLIWTVQARAD